MSAAPRSPVTRRTPSIWMACRGAPRSAAAACCLSCGHLLLQLASAPRALSATASSTGTWSALEVRAHGLQRASSALHVLQRGLAGHGLDAPDAAGDAPLAHDPEQPDLARGATCVPPQSSTETSGSKVTTRTVSPYFSPKRAIAPRCRASASGTPARSRRGCSGGPSGSRGARSRAAPRARPARSGRSRTGGGPGRRASPSAGRARRAPGGARRAGGGWRSGAGRCGGGARPVDARGDGRQGSPGRRSTVWAMVPSSSFCVSSTRSSSPRRSSTPVSPICPPDSA
jgi:hypothetical protein